MTDKRQFKRYYLDVLEINGKMSLTDKVKILDISEGGVSLKADRRLNIGKEYLLKLQEKGKTLDVKGTVVRSELSGTEESNKGGRVSIYKAGLIFNEGFADKISAFLKSLNKTKAPSMVERRLHVRFTITTPQEKILSYPVQFTVKSISLGGMRIQTEQSVETDTSIPMDLSLDEDKSVKFIGRVVSCTLMEKADQTHHDIGVEFTNLTDEDKTLIKEFIDYLAEFQAKNNTE
jgi:Tfp pilus assembly protein PilZ